MNAGVIMKRSREASLQPKVVVLKIIEPLSKSAEERPLIKGVLTYTTVQGCM